MISGALKTRQWRILVTIAFVLVLLSLVAQPMQYIKPPVQPDGDGVLEHAAVTIKTQAAANYALENGAIRGIDVSQYQGTINWPSVAKDNVNFAICRASVGMKADTYFTYNMQNAYNNGIKVGAYHYAKFTNRATMIEEANFFISKLHTVNVNYPVMLDIEANRGLNRNALTTLAVEFMDMVKAEGYTVMLYSYTNFIRDYLNTSMLGDYNLWVANYLEQPAIDHHIWQHTSYGAVSGINGRVDINVAYNDLIPRKGVTVDRDISWSIKGVLNSRYNAGLPIETLDMPQMNEAIITGLQMELNAQLGANLFITGECDIDTLNALGSINFVAGQTGGNITYLVQAALFYKGYYTGQLTATLDDNTVSAVKNYQSAYSLTVSGIPDYDTLRTLFY